MTSISYLEAAVDFEENPMSVKGRVYGSNSPASVPGKTFQFSSSGLLAVLIRYR